MNILNSKNMMNPQKASSLKDVPSPRAASMGAARTAGIERSPKNSFDRHLSDEKLAANNGRKSKQSRGNSESQTAAKNQGDQKTASKQHENKNSGIETTEARQNKTESAKNTQEKGKLTKDDKAKFEARRADRIAVNPLKLAVQKIGGVVDRNSVLSLLTGRLENVDAKDIPKIVSDNPFISEALSSEDMAEFMEEERDIGELAEMLAVPALLIQQAVGGGLNPLEKVTAGSFLRALNVDPQRASSELSLMKDNVALEGLQGYMHRAMKLSSDSNGLAEKPQSNEEIYRNIARNAKKLQPVEGVATPKPSAELTAILSKMMQQGPEQVSAGSPTIQSEEIPQENIGDGFSPMGLPGEGLPERRFSPKDQSLSYDGLMAGEKFSITRPGSKSQSIASQNNLTGIDTIKDQVGNMLAGANAVLKMDSSKVSETIQKPLDTSSSLSEMISKNKLNQDIISSNNLIQSGGMPEHLKPITESSVNQNQGLKMENILESLALSEMSSEKVDDFVSASSDSKSGFSSSHGDANHYLGSMKTGIDSPNLRQGAKVSFVSELVDASSNDFRNQIIEKANNYMAKGMSRANFQLNSPELGQINLAMQLDGDKLDLKMMSSSPQVREMLAIEIPKLKEALESQNIQLQDVNVGVDSEGSGEFAGDRSGDRQREIFEQFEMNRKQSLPREISSPVVGTQARISHAPAKAASHSGQIQVMA